MYLKILGSVIAVASAAIAGFWLSGRDEKHIWELGELRGCLMFLRSRISYDFAALPEVFESLAERESCFSGFFAEIAVGLSEKREGLDSLFNGAVSRLDNGMDDEDIRQLKMMAAMLTGADKNLQTGAIDSVIDYISQKTEFLTRQFIKNKRVYRSGGVLIGILTAVLLF